MKNVILFDRQDVRENLLPLSYTRPVADFLVGIDTLRHKWERMLKDAAFSNVIATEDMAAAVASLKPGKCLMADTREGERMLLAVCGSIDDFEHFSADCDGCEVFADKVDAITKVYDIFLLNGRQIEDDFEALTRGREGQSIPTRI